VRQLFEMAYSWIALQATIAPLATTASCIVAVTHFDKAIKALCTKYPRSSNELLQIYISSSSQPQTQHSLPPQPVFKHAFSVESLTILQHRCTISESCFTINMSQTHYITASNTSLLASATHPPLSTSALPIDLQHRRTFPSNKPITYSV
jgi:hypothetical protein